MANYTSVVASNICDAAGNKLASGTVSFQATDAGNQPINFQVGGGGQVVTTPATATITNGVISGGFQVADNANTSPAGILYRVTITDNTLNRVVVTYSLVSVTGTTFSLDNYAPTGVAALPPVGGSVNGPLSVSGNLSVTGSLTLGAVNWGAITGKSLNGIRLAVGFAGNDLGAQINAADADLGSTAGEIWITGGGTITTAIVPAANHTYRFFPGTYNFPTPFSVVGLNNVRIIGEPGCIFNNTQTGYTGGDATISPLIKMDGTAGAASVLTANGVVGATSVAVTSGTGFAAGQNIVIIDTRFAEVNRIASSYAGGTTIPLERPLEYTYTTVRGAQATPYTFSQNFTVEGLKITGTSVAGAGVLINNAIDGTVRNIQTDSIGGRGVLLRNYSSRVLVENIEVNGLNAATNNNNVESYITTSHITLNNIRTYNAVSNGVAIHGFHQILSNIDSFSNTSAGIQVDTGADISISSSRASGNHIGVAVSGGTLNTTEATNVTLTNVDATDNTGDGLNAGTGGNVLLHVSGGQYYRNNTGAAGHGGMYFNGLLPGSSVIGAAIWGNVGAGVSYDSSMIQFTLVANSFVGPTLNTIHDQTFIGTLDYSAIVANIFNVADSGAPGTNCYVLGNRGRTNQFASAIDTLNLNGNPLTGVSGATLVTAAPTVSAGQVGLGSTTATSATAGANGAVPAQVVGYLIVNVAGTSVKVPYFNT